MGRQVCLTMPKYQEYLIQIIFAFKFRLTQNDEETKRARINE